MTWGRGSTRASRKTRAIVLNRDLVCRCPGCPRCSPSGCVRPSDRDDHVIPLEEGGTDDLANHAGKCTPCHDHKSAGEAARGRARRTGRRPPKPHPGLL